MAPRYFAQRALRAIMMHFSPYLLISKELVPSPYFAAFMAGNGHLRRFGAGTFVRATRKVDLGAVCRAAASGSSASACASATMDFGSPLASDMRPTSYNRRDGSRHSDRGPAPSGLPRSTDIFGVRRRLSEVPRHILRHFTFCPRARDGVGADVPEGGFAVVALLPREFERGVTWPTSIPAVTDVLKYFVSTAATWNVTAFSTSVADVTSYFPGGRSTPEPAEHRSADDFIVHPDLGLNSRPPKIARPGEVDTAVTRLQCRDLQGRFIEATWTCATHQQKSDKQKGQRPDFRPHYAPSRYWKAPS